MEEEKKEVQEFNEEEFLKKVEKAAQKGTSTKAWWQWVVQILPVLIIFYMLSAIGNKVKAFGTGLSGFTHFENGAETNDLVIENHGIFGYTAANFEEAILGDFEKLKKLEVFQQEVSDVSTVTATGFINWSIFTKNQLITYNGTAVYTVDLSTLSARDISFNAEEKILTLKIPHAVQEEINIPEDKIQFGNTDGGLLAFGDIKTGTGRRKTEDDRKAEGRQRPGNSRQIRETDCLGNVFTDHQRCRQRRIPRSRIQIGTCASFGMRFSYNVLLLDLILAYRSRLPE